MGGKERVPGILDQGDKEISFLLQGRVRVQGRNRGGVTLGRKVFFEVREKSFRIGRTVLVIGGGVESWIRMRL